MGLRVQGSVFAVWALRLKVQSLGIGVWCVGFGDWDHSKDPLGTTHKNPHHPLTTTHQTPAIPL
jgi:hypothetical protein